MTRKYIWVQNIKKAYKRSKINEDKKFIAYCKYNKWWLEDYALYMAIKDYLGGFHG
ncbi:MAG: 4-alpha-glucanotransferase [Anaerococcus obesiensis]